MFVGGVTLQDSIIIAIRSWIAKHRLRRYLYEKGLSLWKMFQNLDWKPQEAYLQEQSTAFQLWFSKHCTNLYGIGSKMKVTKLWKTDLYPCCQKVREISTTHLLLCDGATISTTREKLFRDILHWLQTIDTSPTILQLLTSFGHGESPNLNSNDPTVYQDIYTMLRETDVASMWMGLLPNHLAGQQNHYYRMIGSKNNGDWWTKAFVGKMLRATHTMAHQE